MTTNCGPLAKEKVHFKTEEGGKLGKTRIDAQSTARSELDVDAPTGIAECFWLPNSKGHQTQEATATLVAAPKKVMGDPDEVRFTANLNLDGRELAILVKELTIAGVDLKNNNKYSYKQLSNGIVVVFCATDGISAVKLQKETINRATFYVSVEAPDGVAVKALEEGAYHTMVLPGQLKVQEDGSSILWKISDGGSAWFKLQFARWNEEKLKFNGLVLARLTLKGNNIYTQSGSPLYLDGDTRTFNGNQLWLPSGDGRRGGDFEMWFYLTDQ